MPTTESPVLVTGAAGFVASHIVRLLLERGYHVRGTVRSLAKEKALAHLRALPGAERLTLVEADLMRDGSFDAPAVGCACVIHTASPYALDVKDPQRELVDPAVNGTLTVLQSCQRATTVTRVVLTSSVAAITDEPPFDHVLTEADWNGASTLRRNPYYLSKTLAERAGWKYVETQRPAFDLVAVNPFGVIGPSLSPTLNVTNSLFVDLLRGRFPAIISMAWGFVDVRDVAEAHVRALEPNAKGRYLCAAETVPMSELVALLERNGWGKGHTLPTLRLDNRLGDAVVRLSSYTQPHGTGTYLRTHLGRTPRFDHSKAERDLGLTFRPVDQSIVDTLADLKRWGYV